MFRMKLLSMVLITVFTIGLVGCSSAEIFEIPTTITRTSDGAQISLGMHTDEIENILDRMSEEDVDMFLYMFWYAGAGIMYGDIESGIEITYNATDRAYSILVWSQDWHVSSGVYVGAYIQDWFAVNGIYVTDDFHSEIFPRAFHNSIANAYIISNPEDPPTGMILRYDEERKISSIMLSLLRPEDADFN